MIEIIDCEQRSPQWYSARAGIPTASEFSTVMAKGKDGGASTSVTRKTYMLKLAGELITGEPMEGYENAYMARGRDMEPEARDIYAFVNDAPLTPVGFVRNGRKGCSPDSLIGDNGGLEIKTAAPHILIPFLLRNEFPAEHKAQVQGTLWVAEREWWDLCVYWPKMPLFTVRAFRDDLYIKQISDAVDRFNDELSATVEKIKTYGNARAA